MIKKYKTLLDEKKYHIKCAGVILSWYSEKDNGMYDAINKGFAHATGDIYAYINSDDTYVPGTFQKIVSSFEKFPEIQWLKGTTCVIKENGELMRRTPCFIYNQSWIQKGIYGRYAYFIQQESVFWRKELWQKIDGIDTQFKLAGDYWLWKQFARHEPLWSLDEEIACFRRVSSSLSNRDQGLGYRAAQKIIIPPSHDFLEKKIMMFFWLTNKLTPLKPFWIFVYPLLFKKLKPNYVSLKMGIPAILKTKSYVVSWHEKNH